MRYTAEPELTPEARKHIEEECKVPPSPGVLFTKPKGGVELTYVDSVYIIDRLNHIFGAAGWSHSISEQKLLFEEKDGDMWTCAYHVTVCLNAAGIYHEDSAVGHGKSKRRGDALESAIKEAPTDALKRCARFFGKSLGLALYSERDRTSIFTDAIYGAKDMATLEGLSKIISNLSSSFKQEQLDKIRDAYGQRKKELAT